MLYTFYADPKSTLLTFTHFVRAFNQNWRSHYDLRAEGPQLFLGFFSESLGRELFFRPTLDFLGRSRSWIESLPAALQQKAGWGGLAALSPLISPGAHQTRLPSSLSYCKVCRVPSPVRPLGPTLHANRVPACGTQEGALPLASP